MSALGLNHEAKGEKTVTPKTKRKGTGKANLKAGSMFVPATRSLSHFKCGILGDAGSGKSTTASLLAIGLWKYAKLEKPIFFLDTEDGSDWLVDLFADHDVPFYAYKSRAFIDLLKAVKESEEHASVLVIDSISHFWIELVQAFRENKKKRGKGDLITIQDWGFIKPEWQRFTSAFLSSSVHAIICGRAQEVFEEVERDGHRRQEISDVRMQTEKNLGYEPSLLIQMKRDFDKASGETRREAIIRKDKNPGIDTIDGKRFVWTQADLQNMKRSNVVFSSILPHVEKLQFGAERVPISERSSEEMFDDDGAALRIAEERRRKLGTLDEIKATFTRFLPGRSAEDQKLKADLLNAIFSTASWIKVESMKASKLEAGLATIIQVLEHFAALPHEEQVAARLDVDGFILEVVQTDIDKKNAERPDQETLPF